MGAELEAARGEGGAEGDGRVAEGGGGLLTVLDGSDAEEAVLGVGPGLGLLAGEGVEEPGDGVDGVGAAGRVGWDDVDVQVLAGGVEGEAGELDPVDALGRGPELEDVHVAGLKGAVDGALEVALGSGEFEVEEAVGILAHEVAALGSFAGDPLGLAGAVRGEGVRAGGGPGVEGDREDGAAVQEHALGADGAADALDRDLAVPDPEVGAGELPQDLLQLPKLPLGGPAGRGQGGPPRPRRAGGW